MPRCQAKGAVPETDRRQNPHDVVEVGCLVALDELPGLLEVVGDRGPEDIQTRRPASPNDFPQLPVHRLELPAVGHVEFADDLAELLLGCQRQEPLGLGSDDALLRRLSASSRGED